jgi:hypothetical protein
VASFVMVSVDSGAVWPSDEQVVNFGGQLIRLIPPRRDDTANLRAYPMAAIEYSAKGAEEELVGIIRRFLSAMAWRDQVAIREVDVTYGFPIRRGTRIPDNGVSSWFTAEKLSDPSDGKARLALAFYHEGLDLEHIHRAYSFLSFFKVLNIRFNNGRDQVDWMNANAGVLRESEAVARLKDIAATVTNVGSYLYESGRCAVAHAFAQPLVDPHDIRDQQRLSRDWPVARSFAALLIQTEWHIPAPPWRGPV